MDKNRLEAFSDGVIAIIITIMVLELKVPESPKLEALIARWPLFFCYILSYIYIGIYWNNHHHMLKATERVNGAILWANLHLLFWLSLFPFVTRWMGEDHFGKAPTSIYGVVLLLAALAYTILQNTIIKEHGRHSVLAAAVGKDRKGKLSVILYIAAIPLAFLKPWIAGVIYVAVALIWLIPDRRIERLIGRAKREK
jgi:uncharacterized membrane protein